MHQFEVLIDEFVSFEPQPGIVKCSATDAWNIKHTFIDKVPVFSLLNLSPENSYPQKGTIQCELIREWVDDTGRKIFTVSTEKPDGVETIYNIAEFDFLEYQISIYSV